MKRLQAFRRLMSEVAYAKRTLTWRQFAGRVARKLAESIASPSAIRARLAAIGGRSDVADIGALVRKPHVPADPTLVVEDRTLNWVIPDFGAGSGGHLNIFRFIALLERDGYSSRIYIEGPTQWSSGEAARQCVRDHFAPVDATVDIGTAGMAPATFTFATTWRTAYVVRAFAATRAKCYFVQDFEPFFFPHGSDYVLAENTYRFGFVGVTAGDWLANTLRDDYGMRTQALSFSYDKQLYRGTPVLPKNNPRPRVFFYARPPTPRRAFELGVLILAEVASRHPEVEIVMAGWDLAGYSLPFVVENKGVLPHAALPALFHSCDIALVLSYSNVSLLPLDLMACGCCVVSNKGGCVEWLLDDGNAVLCDSTVDAMADGISSLLRDPERRAALQASALTFAQGTNWEREGRRFGAFLDQELALLSRRAGVIPA